MACAAGSLRDSQNSEDAGEMQSGKHHGKQRRDSKAVTRNDRDKHKYGAAAGKECLQGLRSRMDLTRIRQHFAAYFQTRV